MKPITRWIPVLALLGLLSVAQTVSAKDEDAPNRWPVQAVGDQRLRVDVGAGQGSLALYASRPLDDGAVQADIDRAVLVFHGRLRDADVYWRSARQAAAAAPEASRHTLLIVPQFLAERDVSAHALAADTLRWSLEGWMGGDKALGPAPVSSFEAIDAVLGLLADRQRFPRLRQVVVAGHSGGGQVVQRYAVVGQGEAALAAAGVAVRYVVANPSSYLYFSAERPLPAGGFSPADAQACPGFNSWKYGWTEAPPYARQLSPEAYEARYVQRDVVYLLGGADTNPQHPALDRSCAAETQGLYRLYRGQHYLAYLQQRHAELRQQAHVVPGVGHEGDRMLGSACGLAALFDDPAGRSACDRP
ncbi:MAG: alpha/beta hydrolase [Curvibacter sp.]|nr:alpha/beta hydrolase [Curvibacter sp.]